MMHDKECDIVVSGAIAFRLRLDLRPTYSSDFNDNNDPP